MATTTMVFEAATLVIASNDLTEQFIECELSAQVDEKDITTFASAGWKEARGGLRSGELKVKFLQTFTDNGLDEIMWDLFLTRTAQTFTVKADDAVTSSSNPAWSGKVLIKSWSPIKGKPGDVAEVDCSMPTSGAITRATS